MRNNVNDSFYLLHKDDKYWLDKEGKLWNIYEMDIWHVYYTVKMLEKRNKKLMRLGYSLYQIPDLLIERYEKEFCNIFPQYCI